MDSFTLIDVVSSCMKNHPVPRSKVLIDFCLSVFYSEINDVLTLSHFAISEKELANSILAKGYLPKDNDSPSPPIIKTTENEKPYFLSKLSDKDLIKLLNDQPKHNVRDQNGIGNTVTYKISSKADQIGRQQNLKFTKRETYYGNQEAVFRLQNKPVANQKIKLDSSSYAVLQKLNTILYRQAIEDFDNDIEDESQKELLFDVLVAQLKTLCCKRTKSTKTNKNSNNFKPLLSQLMPQASSRDVPKHAVSNANQQSIKEYIFLILNEGIIDNSTDDLVAVDPDSLNKNSSVLLLGPITSPLNNTELKLVMKRITNEITKPDYLPILQQLSTGTLSGKNIRLMKSLVSGPETRRYIKPHRCNHQAPITKVYGGPKWVVCTGYFNLNSASFYD